MPRKKYVVGIDYGTDSVRSLIVDSATGEELSSAVFEYPRWKEGKYCDPSKNQFRQHPQDYIDGMEKTLKEAIEKGPEGTSDHIVAISIDTTGSTLVAVDEEGIPLALKREFKDNPNAMFVLWKDHTAVKEADEINKLARTWGGVDYTKYEGGIYSSEWFFAKVLHVMREDKAVREAAHSWVEHCDWMPGLLTGNARPDKLKRSRCAAGHKAMWHTDWNGLPSEEFLGKLDPVLKGLRQKLYNKTYTIDTFVGNLTQKWARKFDLDQGVLVGVGAFDAHLGAVGGEIKPYYLSKVMGTSTCDMLVAPKDEVGNNLVKGICGQVDGSIIPNLIGLEAGQSAFGDIYAWFKNMLLGPVSGLIKESSVINDEQKEKLMGELADKMIPHLSERAAGIPVEESAIVALDWMNGRRTPDANQLLKGAITGLTLGSDAARIFKALVEATAFGAKSIVDRFIEEGVRIDGIIALGGVAKKSEFVMQTVADVLNMPIKVAKSEQTCALGAAMAAATAGGVYFSIEDAQKNMGSGFEKEYLPNKNNATVYQKMYKKYHKLGTFVETKF
jgi:L-ribulokinase